MDKKPFETAFDPEKTRVVDLSTGEDVFEPSVVSRAKLLIDRAIEEAGGVVVLLDDEDGGAEIIPLFGHTPEGDAPA